jgi:hypothetical protein
VAGFILPLFLFLSFFIFLLKNIAMKTTFSLIVFVFLSHLTFQFSYAQGYRYDASAKRVFGPPEMEEYGFANKKLPERFSLEAWAPPVMEQVGGTCAGFATAYAAASTLFNIRLNITDELTKHFFAFDPYYFYSLNAVLDADTCEKGMMIQAALVNAVNYGFKHALLPPAPSCSQEITVLNKGLVLSNQIHLLEFMTFCLIKRILVKRVRSLSSH